MHKVVYDQPFSCIYCQEGFPNTEELLRHQQVWALTQLHLLKIFAKRIIVNSVFYIHSLRRGPTGPSSLAPAT